MTHLRFFIKAMNMTIGSEMMYKFNFLLRMFTLLSFDLVMPFVTILIYLNTNGFPGWSFYEIVLFQGVFIFINGLDRLFFQQVDWMLSHTVKTGDFDRVLLYPVNTLAYLSFNNIRPEHIMNLIVGLAIMLYASFKLQISLSFHSFLLFLLFVAAAMTLVYSMAVLRFSLIIRAVSIGRIGELFRTIRTYGEYPVNIYSSLLSSILRYLLPLSIVAYFPSRVLLQRSFEVTPLIAVFFIFIFSETIWRRSLKDYTSAGG